jgi:conjugal transfer/type IV secretion protein DotA/TraY
MKIRSLSFLLLSFAVSFALAEDISFDTIFVAPANDISIYYLSLLFGTVSNVLVGGSNAVVGQMFYVFNTGIITFTAMLIFYTMTLSVVNTAQDGNAMGQKVSTWIVLRIVTGMSLLVPTYAGYSAIQVLVMWSVVQGVGFADTIWTQTLDTMSAYGGTVVVPVNQGMSTSDSDSGGTDTSQWKDQMMIVSMGNETGNGAAKQAFSFGVCAMALYNQCLSENSGASNISTLCSRSNYGYFRTSQDGSKSVWQFGKVSNPGTNGYGATMETTCGTITSPNNNEYYNMATDNLVMAIGPMAMDYYSDALTTCDSNNQKCDTGTLVASTAPNQGCAYGDYNDAYVCSPSQMMISAAATYYSISMAARINEPLGSTEWMESAKNGGWAMAGSYYYNLVGGGANTQLSLKAIDPPDADAPPLNSSPIKSSSANYYTVYNNMIKKSFKNSSNNSYPPLQWYSNNAYCYLRKMSSLSMSPSGSGTGASSSPQEAAYDKFAGEMLNKLNISNPLGSLSDTGKSAYFGYTAYGDFTKYPGYVWNMLSSNLASLAGIELYVSTTSSSLYPSGSGVYYSAPGKNANCSTSGSCASDKSPNYTGCFSQLSSNECLSNQDSTPPFSGLLGQANASANSYLSDPLLSLATTGRFMLNNSMNYWTTVISQTYMDAKDLAGAYMGANTATAVAFSLLAFWASFAVPFDVGGAFGLLSGAIQAIAQFFFQLDRAVMESWLPFGTALAMMFFMLGIMMGVYLPFIPFLLYLFGVIGWLISVVEAMVAAPLVAMGVTHPEGHDLLGKAEQSVMLLLGVFIRPAAMVIGLILAITLNYIMVGFFNYGFIVTVNPILENLKGGAFQLLIVAACLIVYVYILIEVINQCFSMIFQVPDKLLRWIGGPQEQSSAAQAMNQIKGGVSSSAQQAGQGASSSAGRAPQASPGSVSASTSFDQDGAGGGGAKGGKE